LQVHCCADRLPSRRENRERFISSKLYELPIVSLDTITP